MLAADMAFPGTFLLLPALSPHEWSVVVLAAALGGLTRGFTGFGFAMIFMPLASTVLAPQTALAVIWIIDAPFALALGARALPKADKPGVLSLLVTASLMFPVGVYVLTSLDPVPIRWVISGLIVTALGILISGWRYHGRPGLPLTLGVGGVSGLFSGLASLGGMPVALFWLSSQTRKPIEIRADMQSYFGLATFVSGAVLAWKGILSVETLVLGALMMPVYGAMLYAGTRGFRIASETTFRRIAYGVIFTAAVISLPVLDGWLR